MLKNCIPEFMCGHASHQYAESPLFGWAIWGWGHILCKCYRVFHTP